VVNALYLGTVHAYSAAIDVAKAQMVAHLATTLGAGNPHSLPEMPVAPTVTLSVGASTAPSAPYAALTQSALWSAADARISYEGGAFYEPSATYRRFPCATKISGGSAGATANQVAWRASINADAAAVGIAVLGATNNTCQYRFLVNDQYVSLTPSNTTAGGRQYFTLDFGSKVLRKVSVELCAGGGASGLGAFRGFFVAVGDTLSLPAARPRMIVLGDSYTATTGAGKPGDGYAIVMADYLGVEVWASGIGGSGYIATSSGTEYKLSDRIAADLDRALLYGTLEFVVVAMGVNDIGAGDVTTEAGVCFNIIRAKCPVALVMVFGPWNVQTPTQSAGNLSAENQIRAAAGGRAGFYFVDNSALSFDNDGTHPTNAGHATIGSTEATAIRAALAA
jgi:lysophospholipase L1-like esterase